MTETEKAGSEQQNMDYGIASERVIFHREKSDIYPDMPLPDEDVLMLDVKTHLTKTFNIAAREGHLPRTATHYMGQLEKIVTSEKLQQFKAVVDELHQNRFDDKQIEVGRKKLNELCGSLKVIRRNK